MSNESRALTIAAKASKSLTTATAALSKVALELAETAALQEATLEQISEGQASLDKIVEDTALEARKQAVELNIKVSENEDEVLASLLSKRGLANIKTSEVTSLQKDLATAKSEIEAVVEVAVSEALRDAEALSTSTAIKLKAENSVLVANLNGKIGSLEDRNIQLSNTIIHLQSTISEERTARVEVAKASQPIIRQVSEK